MDDAPKTNGYIYPNRKELLEKHADMILADLPPTLPTAGRKSYMDQLALMVLTGSW